MIRKLLNVLYRQVPAPMVVVLLLELYALVLLPTDPLPGSWFGTSSDLP